MERTPVPSHLLPSKQDRFRVPATAPQLKYIRGLRDERNLFSLSDEQRIWLEADDFARLSKGKASEIIQLLQKLPKDPSKDLRGGKPGEGKGIPDVPAGRYAVENEDGELRFYRVWRGKNGATRLYVLHGPDSSPVHWAAFAPILRKIAADVRGAAIRFGNEIGACSNCGRRLTNRISRELGIGPVCGGRMFGEGFKDEVKTARERIVLRGEDPDEEM